MTWLSSSSCPPARPDRPARRSAGPPPALVVIEVEASQDTTTVVITGELDLTTRSVLTERLSPILHTSPRRLVLDMAGTGFMDCGSARLIASVARSLPEDSRLIIRRPSQAVRRVLGLTGFDANLEIDE
jgi:anti-anti-sigma factor